MIPETFDRLRDSERGVSPVIGVILMVAITVILAAVIAAFVLGFGAGAESPPQASLSMDAGTDGNVTISHSSGEELDLNNVYLRGIGTDESVAELGENDILRGGESITVNVTDGFDAGVEINLVWEVDGEASTLASTTA